MNKYILISSEHPNHEIFRIRDMLDIDLPEKKTSESDKEWVEVTVNIMINNGYIPLGGISIRHGSQSGAYFVQAMLSVEER